MEKVVFLTPNELISATNMIDEAKSSGYKIIVIPENLKERIKGLKDISGNPIRDLDQFYKEYEESFEFKFVEPHQLTEKERKFFEMTDKIVSLIGGKPKKIRQVKISETMRREFGSWGETTGVWDPITGTIIIRRSELESVERYAGTLLHEVAHALSRASDVSREFELELTKLLGKVAEKALERQ